ncbi:MAG: MerR family transcriptional regulator [Prevotellaceae bacterium]|jgi:DNA-binding transcriptional MerR regulator|nr:MerR family transcriptional regulator [Prevotellaceae bacterium]
MEPETDRIYDIGEVAEIVGVDVSTIRYWTNEAENYKIVSPIRNAKGNRRFTMYDKDTFKIMYNLVKERRYTVQGALQRIRDNRDEEIRNAEVVEKLQKIKSLLLEVKTKIE